MPRKRAIRDGEACFFSSNFCCTDSNFSCNWSIVSFMSSNSCFSSYMSSFLSLYSQYPLTHIGKSWKQNPKIGCLTERHFRKQNPRKFRKICFGCVTERHFWKQNPDKNPEYLVISLIFWVSHRASFSETKSSPILRRN